MSSLIIVQSDGVGKPLFIEAVGRRFQLLEDAVNETTKFAGRKFLAIGVSLELKEFSPHHGIWNNWFLGAPSLS